MPAAAALLSPTGPDSGGGHAARSGPPHAALDDRPRTGRPPAHIQGAPRPAGPGLCADHSARRTMPPPAGMRPAPGRPCPIRAGSTAACFYSRVRLPAPLGALIMAGVVAGAAAVAMLGLPAAHAVGYEPGEFAFDIAPHGSAPGEFGRPEGVAFGPGGIMAVADVDRVQVFHANGTFAYEFGSRGSGPGEFEYPAAVAFGPGGITVVADL